MIPDYELPSLVCPEYGGDDIREDPLESYKKCFNPECKAIIDDFKPGSLSSLSISNNEGKSKNVIKVPHDKVDKAISIASRQINYLSQVFTFKPALTNLALNMIQELRQALKNFTGYNMQHIGTAIVIAAVKILGLSYSMTRIIKASLYDEEKIYKAYTTIQKYFKIPESNSDICNQIKEVKVLREHCNALKISKEIAEKAENILQRMIAGLWINGGQKTKIAVALWAAVKEIEPKGEIGLKEISAAIGPAPKTISANYREISLNYFF